TARNFEIIDEVQNLQLSEPATAYQTKQTKITPPEGFMTGDEFERRVKERVTKFYRENGLL
ncbi:MAG: hypothetical protein LBS08_02255, partial [Candidatus Symbiothrix sp.]|nr:hypothetical protein [Candidatus Symbiothrix sp.]